MVADDQLINIEALKINFQELGIEQCCEYYINGQQVIDAAKENIDVAIL